MMRLYHYTCLGHLPSIFRSMALHTTEPNLRMTRPRSDDPRVVWLTSNPSNNPQDHWWADHKGHPILSDKLLVRFVLDFDISDADDLAFEWKARSLPKPCVFRWSRWHQIRQADKTFTEAIKRTGGDWRSWYICEQEIPLSRVLRLETSAGEVLWTPASSAEDVETLVAPIREQLVGMVHTKFEGASPTPKVTEVYK